MRRMTYTWHLVPMVVLIVWGALFLSALYAARAIRAFYTEQTSSELAARARMVREVLGRHLSDGNTGAIDSACKKLGSAAGSRITVVARSGVVLGESGPVAARLDNHADRPEVVGAFAGRTSSEVRYSHTVRRTMMYTAVPVFRHGRVEAVVRVSTPFDNVEELIDHLQWRFFVAGGLVGLIATGAVVLAIRRMTRPLERMRQVAHAYSQGDFRARLPDSSICEINDLADSLSAMASLLDERIRSLIRQRNEQDAVLSSMVEGVIAVDSEERVLKLNLAAARLVGADISKTQGRMIQEVVRNTDLQLMIRKTLGTPEPVEGEIIIKTEPQVHLQAHGTLLRDAAGGCIGALVVLNDITRLRRLENMRKEFAANVSHELKTPITSIKASVETLLDGDLAKDATARRFLDIVGRHADRLNAIVDDLLSLSRVEQEAERQEIPTAPNNVRKMLAAAIQACAPAAKGRGITLDLACSDDLIAPMNGPLMEQAVANLIDNAIKYSAEGAAVDVSAVREGDEIRINVADTGCGIAPEHVARLFERFYRVDKARSRTVGGTGLGLSIAKHIVQAHGGRATVESSPGKGSTFSLLLPATEAEQTFPPERS